MKIKKSFTLIEIILCIALLSLIGSLLTYKGKDLILKSRQDSEIIQLQNVLSLAQIVSRSYHSDIEVTFHIQKNLLEVSLFSDEESVSELLKPYQTLHLSLLDDILLDGQKVQDQTASVIFTSNGFIQKNSSLIIRNKKIL